MEGRILLKKINKEEWLVIVHIAVIQCAGKATINGYILKSRENSQENIE